MIDSVFNTLEVKISRSATLYLFFFCLFILQAGAMWETFQSARRGENSFQISEGTPPDFYEREILYLTASVLEQNIATQLPHLILFYDDRMESRHKQQLDLLQQLS